MNSYLNHHHIPVVILIVTILLQLSKSFTFTEVTTLHTICSNRECTCEQDSLLRKFFSYDVTCKLSKKPSVNSLLENKDDIISFHNITNVDTFIIKLSDASISLPYGYFRGLNINYLMIIDNDMIRFDASDLSGLVSIKNLYLSNNNLKSNNFSSFGQNQNVVDTLESLYLRNNSLQTIPDLSSLHQLSYLDLSMNNIQEISAKSSFDFKLLSNLKTLDLSHNKLSYLSLKFFSVEIKNSLEILSLSWNNLIELKDDFAKFYNLEDLSFSANRIKEISFKFSPDLENLNQLDFSCNKLSSIRADAFDNLINLVKLDLSFNLLTFLNSSWFDRLLKLEKLYLQSNHLKKVHLNNFKYLSSLQILDLSLNKIHTMEIGDEKDAIKYFQLDNLRILRLSDNKLTKIKFNLMETFPNLKMVYLQNNYLIKMPMINDINSLTKLDVSNQNGYLQSLPERVFNLKSNKEHMIKFNISMNKQLKFNNKTFCFNKFDPKRMTNRKNANFFLDIFISNETLVNVNKCILKQLSYSFKRTRIFILNQSNQSYTTSDPICACSFRLFLSRFNILIRDVCPFYMSYCQDEEFFDDCVNKAEFEC